MRRGSREFLRIGIVGAFLASLCCLGPLVLIALGIGTAGSVLAIGYGKPYFLAAALLFFLVAAWRTVRRAKQDSCALCDASGKLEKKRIAREILLALGAMIALYLLLTFVLVPLLAPLVYRYLY